MTFTIIAIAFELMQKGKTTATHLAEKYEISKRTIYRYVDYLSACGFPIITVNGRNGGIIIDKNFTFKNLCLTKQQMCFLLHLCENFKLKNEMIFELIEKLKLNMNKYS